MKKTITKIALALGIITAVDSTAQTLTFEEFNLPNGSYYNDVNGNDWTSGPATFRYHWNTAFGGYWESGAAYTNMNDSVNGSFSNLYGCKADTGFNNSKNYVTMQSNAIVSFTNNTTMINGFYVTNTTYAYKAIKQGDSFSRKFGDTTGTNSGGIYAQGEYPDWFALSVKGYRGGNLLTDTIAFYLADYRLAGTSADYALKMWQYVDCSSLGQVDSVKFVLTSSDTGAWGMNTPAFFSMDNLELASTVSVEELDNFYNASLYPNPTNSNIHLNYYSKSTTIASIIVRDMTGKTIIETTTSTSIGENNVSIETNHLDAGVYFVEMSNGSQSKKIKFIKL